MSLGRPTQQCSSYTPPRCLSKTTTGGIRLLHLPQGTLEDAGDVADLLGGQVVVEWDGDARMPGGLGKVGELGDAQVALLEGELGAVERLQAGGG